MTTRTIDSDLNYEKWHSAKRHLDELTSLQACPDNALRDNCLRLSLPPLYLAASQFSRDKHYKSKDTLLEIFKMSFNIPENLSKAREAIQNAIADQKNIVSLRMLYAFLKDDSIEPSQKRGAFTDIFYKNASLSNRIKHCVCAHHLKPDDAGRRCIEKMIQTTMDSPKSICRGGQNNDWDYRKWPCRLPHPASLFRPSTGLVVLTTGKVTYDRGFSARECSIPFPRCAMLPRIGASGFPLGEILQHGNRGRRRGIFLRAHRDSRRDG